MEADWCSRSPASRVEGEHVALLGHVGGYIGETIERGCALWRGADIDVEIAPQDHVAGRDVQLDRAIAEGLRLLVEHPVRRPDPATRPSRALPKLPPRV